MHCSKSKLYKLCVVMVMQGFILLNKTAQVDHGMNNDLD